VAGQPVAQPLAAVAGPAGPALPLPGAELGRQPWVIWGLLRTADATSPNVGAGSVLFTLLGFMGLYALLSVLFLALMGRQLAQGPDASGVGRGKGA
jgi:cytochrome d ubiquinol oxidase subunit I